MNLLTAAGTLIALTAATPDARITARAVASTDAAFLGFVSASGSNTCKLLSTLLHPHNHALTRPSHRRALLRLPRHPLALGHPRAMLRQHRVHVLVLVFGRHAARERDLAAL
jgi:hypothetical protein